MPIQSSIATNFRPHITIAPRTDQMPESEIRGDAASHRQSPSAPDKLIRSVAARLDSLNARLNDVNVAAKAFGLLPMNSATELGVCKEGVRDGFRGHYGEGVKTQKAVHDFLEKIEISKVPAHLVQVELRKLAALGLISDPESQKLNRSFADETGKQLCELPGTTQSVQSILSLPNSSDDFFEQLLAMLGFIKEEYLAIYEELLTKYSDFYKEFNETIMAKMGGWITGKSDGKEVEINGGLFNALSALRAKYQKAPDGVLYPIPGAGPATQADALKWAKAMGLPASCVKSDGNGGYRVMMDLSPLNAMIAALPSNGSGSGSTVTWDSAKFQAWQTGFNSQEGDLKNQLQLFTTKYGNANSYYENFNKILSSQLSQHAEMLKAIVSGVA
jgi:type III secretion system IpaD/SipD/SspD family effector